MLLKRSISLFLAIILITQPITILGSENANSSDVLLTVDAQVFSAVVPTQLPVWMSASGVITTAKDVSITNTSKGPIRIDRIELTNVKADWELVNFDDDFSSFKVGSKKLAMSFNGDKSLKSGNIPLGLSNLTHIDGFGSMPLNYDAKIPAQSTGLVDEIPANVVFTLKWHEVGSADIEENNPNIYEFVPADTKILTINFKGVTADDNTVVWMSSDEAVATVADYVSKGRARPIDGSKQCIVTAVGSGKATITGVLGDGTANSFEVVVANRAITSLEATKAPDKVAYIEGENFNPAGIIVTATYNNGTSMNVPDYVIADGNNLVMGQDSVTISYNGKSTNQAISVVAKSLTSIAITTPPNKTSYVEGNSFDAMGMVVTAYYDNGTNKIVVPTLSRDTNLVVGQTNVDISYGGQTTAQSINVGTKSIDNIVITSPPTKMAYIEGNSFDVAGMIVTANYNNGTTSVVDPVLGRNTNLITGQTSVDVSFGDKTITQAITVAAKTLTSIAVTTPPTKKAYIEANNFDATGMVVTATYNNGLTAVVVPTFSRHTNLTVGQTSIDVNFGGKTITQAITVAAKTLTSIAITTQPTKKAYIEANNFNSSGMVVTAYYNNGTSNIISPTLSRNTNLTTGQTSVDISFGGKTITQAITVAAKSLVSIAITTPPSKTIYAHLDNFDRAGMIVTASYNNGTTEDVTSYTVPDGTNMIGNKTSVTISYNGKTTTQDILVNDIIVGTKYTEGNYEYSYGQGANHSGEWVTESGQKGWGVKVIDKTQNNYASPLTTIQGYPVINMSSLFTFSQATTLNLIDWDTSMVTNMNNMFSFSKATSINGLSSFDTSNVTNMRNMFDSSQATSLNLSSFDTSNVTTMSAMFYDSKATNLDLRSFNTSKVTNMSSMFIFSKATSLDLSGFDTSNVTNMSAMFEYSKVKNLTARTQTDADKYKATESFPTGVTVTVKA